MKAAKGDAKQAKKNLNEALEVFKTLGADGYAAKAKAKLAELKK
jgi:hypothetical protein